MPTQDYLRLRLLAEMYSDCQDFRLAMDSKARSQTVHEVVSAAGEHYREAEKMLSAAMVKELRATVPPQILAWRATAKGVGEHLLARLLGAIGDPYIAAPQHWEARPGASGGEDDPVRVLVAGEPYARNVAKLWAYCGYGDPSRKRKAGMSAEDAAALGSPQAKMILRVIAESCLKSPGSRYEIIYRKAREEYAGRVHDRLCPQCKGSSDPGQPWRPGHQHGAALRKVAKEILRDLWLAAREAHSAGEAVTADAG
jgi:hypothetical protein